MFKKASVQTAIVGGIFALLIAGITHYTKSLELKALKLTEIELSISKVGEAINEADRESSKVDLSPALSTEADTIKTLERINNEGMEYYTKVNIPAINNLVRAYGKSKTQEEFTKSINEASKAHAALSNYVVQHYNYLNKFKVCEAKMLTRTTGDYLSLLNNRNTKRSEFFHLLASLSRSDFEL